ncbi:hypothetical protein EPH95_13875 [Salicibibacter halophilus]|uniref:Uncharacterized protein n=1 Tax=Salicibibacter halophilus TaxID=2502791 RepID=A0A514LLK4_9BACI|nr:hypothetical protein [Salicibibacter halophilus]QDI92141.1 hypothetical protein EPH95_13875 [Salicibibacter halophilus]
MEAEELVNVQEQPMRMVFPSLFKHMAYQLEETHNIHPHDIDARVITGKSDLKVIIRFGDNFSHEEWQRFSYQAIENLDSDVKAFIHATGKTCIKVLFNDYFNMMKPST